MIINLILANHFSQCFSTIIGRKTLAKNIVVNLEKYEFFK